MALTASQRQVANLIYGIGRRHGLNDARARELVAASYAESGLNPTIRNKTSGAAGLFQLLSSGYVSKANALGGVDSPKANTLAILPDYLSYWRSHPGARPGEAARDVERSGEGAGFYSSPLGLLGGLSAGPATIPGRPAAAPLRAADPGAAAAPIQGLSPSVLSVLNAGNRMFGVQPLQQAGAATVGPPSPLAAPSLPGRPRVSLEPPAAPGKWARLAPGADRKGASTAPAVLSFVAKIGQAYGRPLEIGTGTNHNQFVVGTTRESQHWTGHAADIPATGANLLRLGRLALIAAGMPRAQAMKQTGGVYNLGGYQILFRTMTGGNHWNHLHVGVR